MRLGGWTILFQAVNFLVLAWLLQRLFYRPVLAIIDSRQAESDRILCDAADAKRAAELVRAECEKERSGIADERVHAMADAQAGAEVNRQTLLEAARVEGLKLVADAHEQIGRERAEAMTLLRKQASGVSVELARQLLASATPGVVPTGMIDQLLGVLGAMPENERARLLPADASSVRVVVATPFATGESEALGRRLSAVFGRPVSVQVEVDPALLAGLEIHFASSVLRNTWRDHLATAERTLVKA